MSIISQLEEAQAYLNSTRITDRKRSLDLITDILRDETVAECLNQGQPFTWDMLLRDVQTCLKKECDRVADVVAKKGPLKAPDKNLDAALQLFGLIVKLAVLQGEESINISTLTRYIEGCLLDKKMRVCSVTFLQTLKECILPNPNCLGCLEPTDFISLFRLLKTEVQKGQLTDSKYNLLAFSCISLLLKHGPFSAFPTCFLREQFKFFSQLCQSVNRNDFRDLQEFVVEITLNFCKHTAEDNRMSCILLGEEVFTSLLNLYCSSGHDSILKVNIIEFSYLLITLHHPGGVLEGSSQALAANWHNWKKCLQQMYSILTTEISQYLRQCVKNTNIFLTKGNTTVIHTTFVMLFVEVCKQLFSERDLSMLSSSSCDSIEMNTQVKKKRKIDASLEAFIAEIQTTKSWVWLKLVGALIKYYPDLINEYLYTNFLQTLHTLQLEVKDSLTISYIYEVLSILLDIEDRFTFEKSSETEVLWRLVGDSTLRAAGLNQNVKETQGLLQSLIKRNVVDLEAVMQTYISGVLTITEHHLHSLQLVLKRVNFSQMEVSRREELLNCLLNGQNIKDFTCLLKPAFAEILVALTLKQCPDFASESKLEQPSQYRSLVDLYSKSCFELKDFKQNYTQESLSDKRSFNIDQETLKTCLQKLQSFAEIDDTESPQKMLCFVGLLYHTLSFMVNFEVIRLQNHQIVVQIERILNKQALISFDKYRTHNEKLLKELLEIAQVLEDLFSIKNCVTNLVKEMFPLEFLRGIVGILHYFQKVSKRKTKVEHDLRKALVDALAKYGLVSNVRESTQNQTFIVLVLSKSDYNFRNQTDYELSMSFLTNICRATPGFLSIEELSNILECLRELCSAMYHNYGCVLQILQLIKEVYRHLPYIEDSDYKTAAVQLLFVFYNRCLLYGPDVSVALLDCIEELYKGDPDCIYSLWEGKEVIKYVPEFLASHFQKVRYRAVEVLIGVLNCSVCSTKIKTIHRMEELFDSMFNWTVKVFEIEGELTNERRRDEITFRASSALYTFVSVIVNCNSWIEDSLFAIIRLDYNKKLCNISDGDLIKKTFTVLRHHFNSEHFMEKYVDNLLTNWLNLGYDINSFEFRLLDCNDKIDLYMKYFDICLPLLMSVDKTDLLEAASRLDMNETQVLERCCTDIFGRALSKEVCNLGPKFMDSNQELSYCCRILGDRFRELLVSKIDQVLLSLIGAVTDEKVLANVLGENVLFKIKSISLEDFKKCLEYIQANLCNGDTPIEFLIKNNPKKLQEILLKLELKTCKSENDCQLKCLHQYTIFLDLVMESIHNESLITFLFRDTTYYLIHFTTNNVDPKLRRAALKYLNTFLKNNISKHLDHFQQFLIFAVNSLKNISIEYEELSSICVDSIEFLVITHNETFQDVIRKLDAFPMQAKFNRIRQVQDKQDVTLEQEIQAFLDCDDFATRADGLRHLKHVLATKKNEVSELYSALREIRGFSEDCENSLPHRLTSMLIKLSCFPKESISLEAVKCLGELGPADLTTIVLEPEKRALDIKYPPYEMFTGHVMSLLVQYLVDENIDVVKAASEALYEILCSNESKKVMDHGQDFGYGPINKQFIAPYLGRQQRISSKLKINPLKLLDLEANTELWCPSITMDNNQWITALVLNLLDSFDSDCYLKGLIPLGKVKAKFCEHIFPRLIYLMLSLGNKTVTKALSGQLNNFFQVHWSLTLSSTTGNLICVNKKSVKCMLDVVNFARQQPSLNNSKATLDLNYLLIAKAAVFCSAHFSALLYTELWCQEKISDFSSEKLHGTLEHGYSLLDLIYESESVEITNVLQQILQVSYKSIGELDALSGCGISLLLKPEHRVEYYKNTGQWKHVMDYYCVNPITSCTDTANLIKSFKMNHLYQLPLLCETQSTEPDYECLWRLGQWNLRKKEAVKFTEVNTTDYEKYKFVCLKALRDQDLYTFNEARKVLNMCIIDQLKHTSLESSKSLYPILTQLQTLIEMDDCLNIKNSSDFSRIRDKWSIQDGTIRKNEFQFVEPIAAQRMTMLGEMVQSLSDLRDDYFSLVLDIADYAREEGYIRVAENALIKLKKVPKLDHTIENKLQFREAQLAWLNGDKMIAQQLLRKLCNSNHIDSRLKAAGFMLQGVYMAEMYSDRRTVLNSFEVALQIYKSIRNSLTADDYRKLYDAYDTIATFADKEYQQTMTHINSDLFQKKLSNIKSCKEMAEALSGIRNLSEDQRKAQIINKRQICIDENEVMAAQKSKDIVLELAVKHYVKNLQESDSNNIKIFRIMSLFLENRDNKQLMEQLKKMVSIMPTYKYITMLPQLIPHITTNQQDLFGQQVNLIIERCALCHPHHTLPLLLALVNANKDKEYSKKKSKVPSANERSLTAAVIIKKLRSKVELKKIVDKMTVLSEALIELAYYDSSTAARNNEFDIPAGLKIRKINGFDDVLVPTYTLPVSKNNKYDNIVGINRFLSKYKTVGGINAPKRIECRCTNGKNHPQLVKGQDDLRQDAVMQQVFTIMTDLLSANKQTKNLLIRTYKVVPLSMRSGILEWVANSMPIGEYLTGSADYVGAHKEFRPKDKSPNDCRIKFKNCQGKPFEEKLAIYKSICKDFQPVFHKFFETHFKQPSVWYERRRAYIHSVATASMCGYVLGIGDRHVSNILIDKQTAEVVHIDFGIAFEQGKCLPTPETVPFRLSRDIVDGMGVSGVEGLFRKSCEKTMEVLRCNSQVIVTILEVLLYDPLYFWTVSSAEANKRQTEEDIDSRTVAEDVDEENKNVSAQRALLRLRSKLEGTEDGKPTSVEQQVGTLIQQAMDPANLCKLFYGWQPYL